MPTISIIRGLPSTLVPLYEKSLMDIAFKQHNINIILKNSFRSRFSTRRKAVGIDFTNGDLTKLQLEISANLRGEVREEYKKLGIGKGGDVDKLLLRQRCTIRDVRSTLLIGGFRPKIILRSKLSDMDADHWLSVLNKKIGIPWQDMNLTGIGILLKEDFWPAEIKATLRGEQVSRPL